MRKSSINSSVNSFTKGMQKDIDKSLQPSDSYLHSENFRIVASEDGTTGSLENVKGNSLALSLGSNITILGHCVVRDDLIIFTEEYNSPNRIRKYTIDSNGNISNGSIIYEGSGTNGSLNFDSDYKIKAIGRYESETIKKVYFTDNYNYVRFFNYADPNFSTTSVDEFDMLRKATLLQPSLGDITTGELVSGMVQYMYKLYEINGSETVFSTPSPLYHITEYNEFDSSEEQYKGSNRDVNTGKGFLINIQNNSNFNKFDKLELVAVHYNSLNGAPQIRIVDRISIGYDVTSINILDNGQSIGSYSEEELTVLSTGLFKAETIETKNNYLFAANISDTYFEEDYDCRAYRFYPRSGDYSTAYLYHDSTHRIRLTKNNVTGLKYTYFEVYSLYMGSIQWHSDDNNQWGETASQTGWVVPEDHNCINYFNNTEYETSTAPIGYWCQFQSDGKTLGGEGDNIVYKFNVQSRILDDSPSSNTFSSSATGSDFSGNKSLYRTYSSPWYNSEYKSLQRDEVYRLFMVLEDEYGRESFAKWVGDIRCPAIDDFNSVVPRPNENYQIEAGVSYNIVGSSQQVINGTIVNKYITYNGNTYSPGSFFVGVAGVTSFTTNGPMLLRNDSFLGTYNTGSSQRYDFALTYTNTINNKTYYNILNIHVKVNNLPTTVKAYRFAMVPRTNSDKSVVASGLVSRVMAKTGSYATHGIATSIMSTNYNASGFAFTSAFNNRLWNFVSPEVTFNNGVSYKSGEYFKLTSFTSSALLEPVFLDTTNRNLYYDQCRIQKFNVSYTPSYLGYNIYTNSNMSYITDGKTVSPAFPDKFAIGRIGDYNYKNAVFSDNNGDHPKGLCGTNFTFQSTIDLGFINSYQSVAQSTMCMNYKRKVFSSQYGGYTYNARQLNKSIPCSKKYLRSQQNGYYAYIYGDTFIGMYDHLWSFYDSSIGNPDSYLNVTVVYFPVETSINLNLRLDDCYHRVYNNGMALYMKETAGKHYKGKDNVELDGNYYDQQTDLYQYNSVYSKQDGIKYYVCEPADWESSGKNDCMIKYSDLKINGEEIDSWTKFRSSNYIEVDSTYGSINNLLTYNNNLYFWQDNSFGILSVNPRSLIKDNSGLELTLGTGGILDRYDYLSTIIGNTNKYGITSSQYGIYWLDNKTKDIYRFTGEQIPLSKLKGMRSYMNSIYEIKDVINTTDSYNNEVLFSISKYSNNEVTFTSGTYPTMPGTYNTRIKRGDMNVAVGDVIYIYATSTPRGAYVLEVSEQYVLFTTSGVAPYAVGTYLKIYNPKDSATLVFNEYADSFTSFYSFRPIYYINYNNNYYSIDSHNIYIHNKGDYGSFYGTVYPSTLKVLVNDNYSITKTFDNISFASTTYSTTGTNVLYDTWNELRVYNDYQNTDYVTLTPGDTTSLVRRERGWNTVIPRNKVNVDITNNPNIFLSSNLSDSKLFGERIRDKYAIIDFKYNNTNNYKFNIPYVITDYRISAR